MIFKAESMNHLEMKNDFLRVPSLLCDLQKFVTNENVTSLLISLNKTISSNEEEMDFLCRSDGILVIMSFIQNESECANISLKILAVASKRYERVRNILLNNNIFHILGVKLRNEKDFTTSNFILYSALMVILVQGNYAAQNQMRMSGCLSSMAHILSSILDEDQYPPCKNAEIIIYTIIASNKNPRNLQNRTEIGWITPKILKFLGKEIVYSNSDQLQLVKCFWFLLQCLLDENEVNQHTFLISSGLSILFRSIQDVAACMNSKEIGNLLVKMTGILVKLKSQKEFLHQASNYCPVMILCSLLKTSNSLVIQQIIIFLDSLTQECPYTLYLMRNEEFLKQMKRAKIVLPESETTAEIWQNLWNRLMNPEEKYISQEDLSDSKEGFSPIFFRPSLNNQETSVKLDLFKNHFCIVHDTEVKTNFQAISAYSFNRFSSFEEFGENKNGNQNDNKIGLLTADWNFYGKQLRKKKKKLRTFITQNISNSERRKKYLFNIKEILGGKIFPIFQRFFSFFIKVQRNDPKDSFHRIKQTNSKETKTNRGKKKQNLATLELANKFSQ